MYKEHYKPAADRPKYEWLFIILGTLSMFALWIAILVMAFDLWRAL
jgi:hypothetical protein